VAKREAKLGEVRLLSVYDGQRLIGAMRVAGDGAARAFDPAGKYLGKFPSVKAASVAITAVDLDEGQQIRALATKHRRQRDKESAA